MTRRTRLIRNTVLFCSVPVLLASAWIVYQRRVKDAPYVAGEEIEGITRALDRSVEKGVAGIRFTDVTAQAGIDFHHFPFRRTSQLPEDMGPGAAWADFDGDGLFDVFLPNFAAPLGESEEKMATSAATDRLYRNRGDGTFEDVSRSAGLAVPHRGLGASWGDYDRDGDPDLLVTSWGENILWENRGDGTFLDVTARAGLGGEGFWTGAAWADFDLDGDLDLYVCGYVKYKEQDPSRAAPRSGSSDFPFTLNPSSWPAHPNRLYVNRGDGTFEERAEAAGVRGEKGKSLGAAWADFDADGYPDLYVANDVSDNAMYRNRGDGTFKDVSYEAVVADYRGAMGLAVGDWDGDLDLDLFITHWIAQENALYSSLVSDLAQDGTARLMFVDDADRVGLGQVALDLIGWGTAFVDLDNDGYLDIFVSNGSTFQDREDPTRLLPMDPHLYWCRGPEEGYFEIGQDAGIRTDPPGVGRGASFCDYDDDGDADLLICRNGGMARLLRNDTRGGHWVKFRVEATTGHPAGIGAHLVAYAGERAYLREAGCGPSYLSQNAPDVLVGLGEADRIDSLAVEWPGGPREVWLDLEADRTWIVKEGSSPRPVARAAPPPARKTSEHSELAVVADLSTGLSREQIRRFWTLKKRADAHLLAGEWEAAADTLRRMVEIDPRHEDSLYDLGNCALELGRPQEALQRWEELLRVNPAASRAWIQIGWLHSRPESGDLFDLAAAVEAFRQAHLLNPEHSGPLILWGEAALARGDLGEAERILASAYQMNHQATSALFLGGYLAWKRGDESRAGELLGRAIESLGGETTPQGVPGEGDARTRTMEALQRKAARRGLFTECLAGLAGPGGLEPERAFARVDEVRARLAVASPGAREAARTE